MIERNGLNFCPVTGIGPIRTSPYRGGPPELTDFCDCVRGREARRWHEEGLTILPAVAEVFGECEACEAVSGLRYWRGENSEHGSIVYGVGPGFVARERQGAGQPGEPQGHFGVVIQ